MSDNTQLNAATTVGDVIASDEIGGVKYQRVKLDFGADGSASDVSPSNPLPVRQQNPDVVTVRANVTGAQTDAALVSVGPGSRIVVTRCSISVANNVTADPSCVIGFGSASTPSTSGVLFAHPGMVAGGHYPEGNGGGDLGKGADGEDVRITNSAPTGGSFDVVLSYYVVAA